MLKLNRLLIVSCLVVGGCKIFSFLMIRMLGWFIMILVVGMML